MSRTYLPVGPVIPGTAGLTALGFTLPIGSGRPTLHLIGRFLGQTAVVALASISSPFRVRASAATDRAQSKRSSVRTWADRLNTCGQSPVVRAVGHAVHQARRGDARVVPAQPNAVLLRRGQDGFLKRPTVLVVVTRPMLPLPGRPTAVVGRYHRFLGKRMQSAIVQTATREKRASSTGHEHLTNYSSRKSRHA